MNKYFSNSKLHIITHHGESYDSPENTIAAINLVWERGAEAVEIDIHLSKENKAKIFHGLQQDFQNLRYHFNVINIAYQPK